MVLNCNEVGEKVNPGVDSIVRTGSLASPDGYMETRDFNSSHRINAISRRPLKLRAFFKGRSTFFKE